MNDATITARSTDGSYNFQTKSVNGAFVFNNVPKGVVVEYTATKAGHTSRNQTATFQQPPSGGRNEVNFGSPGGAGVAPGAAFFISDYPEIAAVSPADDSTNVDGNFLTYKVRLSESLTVDGQDRLLDAFRIVPANSVAGGNFDFNIEENKSPTDGLTTAAISPTTFGYELKKNDSFLKSDTNRVRGSWNAEGTELTVTFNAPLRNGDKLGGKYAALLLTNGRIIEDQQGNQLGTSATSMTSYTSGASAEEPRIIFNAFRTPTLSVGNAQLVGNAGFSNWASTHNTVARFEVARDEKVPVLQSVRANKGADGNLRIELEFDEPMAAFAGNGVGRIGGNNLFNLRNYQFAFGADRGGTSGTRLDGTAVEQQLFAVDNVRVVGSPAAPATTFPTRTALVFTNSATEGAVDPNTLTVNSAPAVEVNGNNPKVVNIWIGKGSSLVNGLREIKARVVNISDPAGNSINAPDADANVRTGSID